MRAKEATRIRRRIVRAMKQGRAFYIEKGFRCRYSVQAKAPDRHTVCIRNTNEYRECADIVRLILAARQEIQGGK